MFFLFILRVFETSNIYAAYESLLGDLILFQGNKEREATVIEFWKPLQNNEALGSCE